MHASCFEGAIVTHVRDRSLSLSTEYGLFRYRFSRSRHAVLYLIDGISYLVRYFVTFLVSIFLYMVILMHSLERTHILLFSAGALSFARTIHVAHHYHVTPPLSFPMLTSCTVSLSCLRVSLCFVLLLCKHLLDSRSAPSTPMPSSLSQFPVSIIRPVLPQSSRGAVSGIDHSRLGFV